MSTNLVFTGIYHLPYSGQNKCTDAIFLDDWTEFLESLLTEHTYNIICGDFNLHIDDLNNPDAQVFLDMVNVFGLNNNVSFPTHQRGHTLDLILSECISWITVSEAVPGSFLSDHTSILCDVNIDKPPLEVHECTYRKLKDIDKSEFKNLVDDKLSDLGYNLDEMAQKYEESLQSILNELAPVKSRRMVIRPTNPWFSDSLKEQKKIMQNCERCWCKYRLESNWTAFKHEHNKYRSMLSSIRKEDISTKIAACEQDTKKLHTLVNKIVGHTSENSMPKHDSNNQLAEEFANYFMDKIKKIRDNLEQYPKYIPSVRKVESFSNFRPMTEDEVSTIIHKMSSKSCELDPIPTTLLIEILLSIIKPITQIVNTSLTEGIFAKSWKTAIIHPLIKKAGLALLLSNFRPVSNLSFLSRVTECAVLQQFNNHCDVHNLIPDYQSMYQPNYSCEMALVKITNDILWAMEHQKATNLMAIDLSSAFDTVDFGCLTQVLQDRFGINGKALCWFENYLHPRLCKVNVGHTYSSVRELKCSVPQGSCVGPILYTIYASTLEEVVCGPESEALSPDNDSLIPKIDLHGFADNHALKNSFQSG